MPHSRKRFFARLVGFGIVLLLGVLCGCGDSDSRKAVTRTVEDALGADAVRQRDRARDELNRSMQQELERSRQGLKAGDPPENPDGKNPAR